jgi:hypothetical protein
MTPLAHSLLKRVISSNNPDQMWIRLLSSCSCVDITNILPAIGHVMHELYLGKEVVSNGGEKVDYFDSGEPLVPPNEYSFLEYTSEDGYRYGLFLHEVEDEISYRVFSNKRNYENFFGFIRRYEEKDGLFSLCYDQREEQFDRNETLSFGLFLAAALIVINAPRGFKLEKRPPHIGLKRRVRRILGKDTPNIPDSHTIVIDKSVNYVDNIDKSESDQKESRRAFHFCRGHLRHFINGTRVDPPIRVKACWKGDISLGICRGDYKVSKYAVTKRRDQWQASVLSSSLTTNKRQW